MVQQWPPLYRLLGGVHGPGSFCFTIAPSVSGGDVGSGFSLTAPVLAFASATDPSNDATQDFIIDIADPGALAGDEIVVVAKIGTDFAGSSSAEYDVTDTYLVVAGDVGGGGDFTGEITLTLTSGVAYCRAFHKRGGSYSSPSPTISKTIDTTVPTITSAATANNAENSVLSHTLTANESVTWSIVGGADQARFEISGTTLRWTSNGTQDFETPLDAGANNVYNVTVRATDTAGNTTDQNIAITVTDVGESAFHPTDLFTGDLGYFYDFNIADSQIYSDNGTTAITADEERIYRIDDQENDVAAINATEANRPFYKTNSGIPYADCRSFNDFLGMQSGADLNLNTKTALTIIVGARPHADNAGGGSIFTASDWTNAAVMAINATSTEAVELKARRQASDTHDTITSAGTYAGTDIHVHAEMNTTTGAVEMWLNGASEGTATLDTTGNFSGESVPNPRIAINSSGGLVYVGRVYYVFAINRILTAGERGDFETWAQARMSISF